MAKSFNHQNRQESMKKGSYKRDNSFQKLKQYNAKDIEMVAAENEFDVTFEKVKRKGL